MDLYRELVDTSVPIDNCTNLIVDNENSENVMVKSSEIEHLCDNKL